MEHSDYIISRYCLIRKKRIILNGKKLIEVGEGTDFPSFLSAVYKTFSSEYPKFYKMDLLSKLGLLTTDFLLDTGKNTEQYQPEQIAIVVSNAQSSLETDTRYHQTIADRQNYFPNPGLFVYTLPNLLIGEISIKFGIKGESIFFISQLVDFPNLHTYATNLLQQSGTQAVITGWVDLDVRQNYESALYLVEHKDRSTEKRESWPFTTEAMEDLYFEKNLEE